MPALSYDPVSETITLTRWRSKDHTRPTDLLSIEDYPSVTYEEIIDAGHLMAMKLNTELYDSFDPREFLPLATWIRNTLQRHNLALPANQRVTVPELDRQDPIPFLQNLVNLPSGAEFEALFIHAPDLKPFAEEYSPLLDGITSIYLTEMYKAGTIHRNTSPHETVFIEVRQKLMWLRHTFNTFFRDADPVVLDHFSSYFQHQLDSLASAQRVHKIFKNLTVRELWDDFTAACTGYSPLSNVREHLAHLFIIMATFELPLIENRTTQAIKLFKKTADSHPAVRLIRRIAREDLSHWDCLTFDAGNRFRVLSGEDVSESESE